MATAAITTAQLNTVVAAIVAAIPAHAAISAATINAQTLAFLNGLNAEVANAANTAAEQAAKNIVAAKV